MFNDCAKYVLPCLSVVNISKKTRSLSYPFQKWPQMKHSGVSNLEGRIEVVSVLFYYSFNVWNIVIHQKILQDEYMVHFSCVYRHKYIQKRKKLGHLFVWVCSGNKRLLFSKLTTLPGGLSSVNIDSKNYWFCEWCLFPILNYPFKITKFQ